MLKRFHDFILCSYFFSINFQELQLFNLGFLSIPKIVAFVYLLFSIPRLNNTLQSKKIFITVIPILSYFTLLFLINIFNINEKSYSFFDFTLFINIILFWFIAVHLSRDFNIANKAILCLALGSVFLACFYFFGIGLELDEMGRVSIFGDNPNFVGIKMALSICLILFLVIQNSFHLNWVRYLLLLPIPMMLEVLIETGSRVSFVSLILMIFVGLYFVKKNGISMKIVILLIFSGLILSLYKFLIENQFFLLRLISSVEDKDLSGREVAYAEIWEVVNNNFVFGIGQTGYFEKFGDGSPHNVLLEILCYSGIIGLLMYLLFLLNILRTALKSNSLNGDILPLILFIPLLGLILSGQILTLKLGWCIFAYIASKIYFLRPVNK
jgi:O-antigen ligase